MTKELEKLVAETRIDVRRQIFVCPYCETVMRTVYTLSMDVAENISVPLFCKNCHACLGGVSTCGIVLHNSFQDFDGLSPRNFTEIRSCITKKELEDENATREQEERREAYIKMREQEAKQIIAMKQQTRGDTNDNN